MGEEFGFADNGENENQEEDEPRNLVMVFGCAPNDKTPADSKLVVSFFNRLADMSDKHEKITVLPGTLPGWKPNRTGEVFCITTHDMALYFDQTVCPEAFYHTDVRKTILIAKHAAKMVKMADKKTAMAQKYKLFFDNTIDCIFSVEVSTNAKKILQAYGKFKTYTLNANCMLGDNIFLLGTDSTCQMLIPDFENLRFGIDDRMKIMHEAEWSASTLICLDNNRVMSTGLTWDEYNRVPWIYCAKTNTWTDRKTPGGNQLPSFNVERQWGAGALVGGKIYVFGGWDTATNPIPFFETMDATTLNKWVKI